MAFSRHCFLDNRLDFAMMARFRLDSLGVGPCWTDGRTSRMLERDHESNSFSTESDSVESAVLARPVSYTHLTLPTTPYV